MHINALQFLLLALTSLLFAAAFFLGLDHMRRAAGAFADAPAGLPHDATMGVPARAAVIAAILVGVALLLWRVIAGYGRGGGFAVSNPFDAFLLLAIVLSLALIYFRLTRHLRGLSFFLLPMIVILLLLGLVLAAVHQRDALDRPDFGSVWTLIHVSAIVGATLCFALSCVGGAVYLLADRQLRRKGLDASHRWVGLPPLASIEKISQWMIYVGFPLLTLANVAGVFVILQNAGRTESFAGVAKIAAGILAWVVYAVLLHVPLNPRFRGRRAAWLAIVGFALFLGAFAAAKWS